MCMRASSLSRPATKGSMSSCSAKRDFAKRVLASRLPGPSSAPQSLANLSASIWENTWYAQDVPTFDVSTWARYWTVGHRDWPGSGRTDSLDASGKDGGPTRPSDRARLIPRACRRGVAVPYEARVAGCAVGQEKCQGRQTSSTEGTYPGEDVCRLVATSKKGDSSVFELRTRPDRLVGEYE